MNKVSGVQSSNSASFLLLENGGKIELEIKTGYILLESQAPACSWYGRLSNPLSSPIISPLLSALL